MEVLVTDSIGLPNDAVVSVRFGTTRRQAPLDTAATNPIKFPSSLDSVWEPLKIDILQPIATTRLVLLPHAEQYQIGFDSSEDMQIGFSIKPSAGAGRKDASMHPDSATPVKLQDACSSAKDYIEGHGLLRYVQALLHAVIQAKPDDPYAFMIEQLCSTQRNAKTARERAGRFFRRPTSVATAGCVPPPPPPPLAPPPRKQTQPLVQGGRQSDEEEAQVLQEQLLKNTKPSQQATVGSSHPGVHIIVNRIQFLEEILHTKRVLHVKGFGAGFTDATQDAMALEAKQDQESLDLLNLFCPDYLVVDGDAWGTGFQRHIKAFVGQQRRRGGKQPSLIWAKNLLMSAPLSEGGQPVDSAERDTRLAQAGEWATQCGVPVLVYWIDARQIAAKLNDFLQADASTIFEGGKFNDRGLIHVMGDSKPAWTAGLSEEMEAAIRAIEDPSRGEQQFFEKCSFENAAKGNAIFEVLDSPTLQAHGSVAFGGGESVLLEFASKYLNSTSGFNTDNAALLPHSRGRESDPAFPHHCGSSFSGDPNKTKSEVLPPSLAPPQLEATASLTVASTAADSENMRLHIRSALEHSYIESEKQRLRIRSVLEHACNTGKVAEAVDKVLSSSGRAHEKPELEDGIHELTLKMRKLLEETASSGCLEEAIKNTIPKDILDGEKPTANYGSRTTEGESRGLDTSLL